VRQPRHQGPALSKLTVDLLRASQPHPDFDAFRSYAEDIARRYTEREIKERLHALAQDGFLTRDSSEPRKGWLTAKGRAALERHIAR
jgi:hypothetical protein